MGTNIDFTKLNCSGGCRMDKAKFVFEQIIRDNEAALNLMIAEDIELTNWINLMLVPYLADRQSKGDLEAGDLLYDLNNFVL
jgi:hypothetical protein